MQALRSNSLKDISTDTAVNTISMLLDDEERQQLKYAPWSNYPYLPDVTFSIANSDACIFLKYNVEEKFVRACNGSTNSNVYEDSCVEFFIDLNNSGKYYNIEFNCLGASTIGYGSGKADRVLLPSDVIEKIKYEIVLRNNLEKKIIEWQITLVIPSEVFIFDEVTSLSGRECSVNFYKCGDLLPVPHFLAWHNVDSEEPNFHLPGFFGKLVFG